MNYQQNIVNKLKEELKKENMLQKDFAKKLKISEVYMSRLINQERRISLTIAIKIADYFNISLDELVGRKQYD